MHALMRDLLVRRGTVFARVLTCWLSLQVAARRIAGAPTALCRAHSLAHLDARRRTVCADVLHACASSQAALAKTEPARLSRRSHLARADASPSPGTPDHGRLLGSGRMATRVRFYDIETFSVNTWTRVFECAAGMLFCPAQ